MGGIDAVLYIMVLVLIGWCVRMHVTILELQQSVRDIRDVMNARVEHKYPRVLFNSAPRETPVDVGAALPWESREPKLPPSSIGRVYP